MKRYPYILLCIGVLVLQSNASCTNDKECSDDISQLCCNGFCMAWQNCEESCKIRTDCEWNKNQICHKHRCIEDMNLEYTICVQDKDCGVNSNCRDNKCVSKNITPTDSHHGGQVAWIKALFITGSVVLSLLACIVVYCYRKRCKSPRYLRPTAFPMQRTAFQGNNGYEINRINLSTEETSFENDVISQQPAER